MEKKNNENKNYKKSQKLRNENGQENGNRMKQKIWYENKMKQKHNEKKFKNEKLKQK